MRSFLINNPGSVFLYTSLLWLAVALLLAPRYEYQGFSVSGLNQLSVLASFAWVTLSSFFLPRVLRKPSHFFAWTCFLFIVCPGIVAGFSAYGVYDFSYKYWLAVCVMIFFLSRIGSLPSAPTIVVPVFSSYGYLVFIILSALFLYLIVIGVFGLQAPPSLIDVYDTRLQARETLGQAVMGAGHALRAISNVINPFFVIVGLVRKNWALVFIGCLGQFYVFTADGSKMSLLSPLMVISIFYLYGEEGRIRPAARFALWLAALVAVCLFVDMVFLENGVFTQLFVRRLLFVPGQVSQLYYDYFSVNDFFYWGGRFGVESTYHGYLGPGFAVGEDVYGKVEGNVNGNVFADGYANAGYIGMVLSTVLLSFFLWIYDSFSRRVSLRFATAFLAVPAVAATNSGVLPVLSTHGVLLVILFLVLMPAKFIER